MAFVLLLLLAIGVSATPSRLYFPGGDEATDLSSTGSDILPTHCGIQEVSGTHPWIVKLGYKENGVAGDSFLCAGVLINKRYVLTASTCLYPKNLGKRELSVVHLGDDSLSYPIQCQGVDCVGPQLDFAIESYKIHPGYDNSANDIGLLRLKEEVDFTPHYIAPICLPSANLDLEASVTHHDKLQVGGWITRFGLGAENNLETFDTELQDTNKCSEFYGRRFIEEQSICAKDNCMLSGSPMLLSEGKGRPMHLVGIASYGAHPCRVEGIPSVYTSIAHYRSWIEENLHP